MTLDTKSKQVTIACALTLLLSGCTIAPEHRQVSATIIAQAPSGEVMQLNHVKGEPNDVYHLLGKATY